MTGHVSTFNANQSKWEVMTHLPFMTTHDENQTVDAIQLTNTNLIFTMHPSFVHVYDLSVHKFVDKYPYYHQKQSMQMPETQRMFCATENVNNNVLYAITSNALLSFDLSEKTWFRQMYSHFVLHRLTAGCSMDSTYSFIYIFGGRSDNGSGYDPTVAKYTVTNEEWSTVPNALILQQTDPIQCKVLASDGMIYCVTANVLYSFDPLRDIIRTVHTSYSIQYYSMIEWNDSCIIMIGTSDTIVTKRIDLIDTFQYTLHCPRSQKAEPLASPLKSTQSTHNMSIGRRRHLGSWPIITLNSSYTENLTLEAGNIYVVNTDVEVSSSLIVDDNATILFNGTDESSRYNEILVRGHLLMGTCSNDGTIGVSSNSIRVYNSDTSTTRGILRALGTGYGVSVCNTNFSHILQMVIERRSDVLFSNLEFYGVMTAIYLMRGEGPEIVRNSYFYKGTSAGIRVYSDGYGYTYGGGTVQNNIFELTKVAIQGPATTLFNPYKIMNNTFIGGAGGSAIDRFTKALTICNNSFVGFQNVFVRNKFNIVSHNVFRDNDYVFYGFWDTSVGVVTFNDFIQNGYVVWMHDYSGALDMQYNNFIANDVVIYFGRYAFTNVSYNNFINNSIIFDVNRSPEQLYCGHNYYGITTTYAWDIQIHIDDVCNGHKLWPGSMIYWVQWWPWYNEKIEFDALPVQLTPYGDGSHLVDCRGPNSHPDINGTQLSPIWLGDLVLTADKSPYYVIYHTRINYNLIIEPSVELIWADHGYEMYTTRYGGAVLIGESMCNDTMQYDGIGLYDNNTAIHIHGLYPRFNMQYGTERAYICNTKITGGSYVFNLYMIPGALIDNCEFHHINGYGIFIKLHQFNSTVRDTLFVDTYYAIETRSSDIHYNPGTILIEHNTFQDCARRAIYSDAIGPTLSIISNTFENYGTGIAIEGITIEENVIRDNIFINFETVFSRFYGSNYTGNVFRNNQIVFDIGDYTGRHVIYYNQMINNSIVIQAMHKSTGYLEVKYNNFVDNNVSIMFLNGSPRLVQYNNFVHNMFNYVMKSAVNADCSRNWNGESSDITDSALIQDHKILDQCTPNGYNGKVIFWPYFDGPLFLDDVTNLPALYNLSYTDCTSLDIAAEFVAGQPTRSPSSDAPTTDPTSQPSVEPTAAPTAPPTNAPSTSPTYPSYGPTFYPTTEPTVDPTTEPTTDPTYEPTIEPTRDPTRDPTHDPTNDPTNDPTTDPTNQPTVEPTIDPTQDPTRDPTDDPTFDPTTDPTTDPTLEPTNDPTDDPTFDPTVDPTFDPTMNPTMYPTVDPTVDPTTDPTNNPTTNPTRDPTVDPTIDPTSDPTRDPTTEPTRDPTIDPTTDPSIDPTTQPTADPTTTPTVAPSAAPTDNPNSFAELLDELDINGSSEASGLQSEMLVTLGLGSIAVFILILALLTKRNDDQNYEAVALYLLQCFDLYSDAILAGLLYNYYLHAQSNDAVFDEQQKGFLALLCWVSILSAVVPYFLNIFTSIRIIGKLSREKNIPSFTKDYFDSHTSVYALGVLINGGCYTTLALLNSKLFNLSVFNSGLSTYKLRQFEHFKIFNTVFMENLPQICVQGLALYTFGSQTSIVFGSTIWASFITSLLSVLLSIMTR
eukprot:648812_1